MRGEEKIISRLGKIIFLLLIIVGILFYTFINKATV